MAKRKRNRIINLDDESSENYYTANESSDNENAVQIDHVSVDNVTTSTVTNNGNEAIDPPRPSRQYSVSRRHNRASDAGTPSPRLRRQYDIFTTSRSDVALPRPRRYYDDLIADYENASEW